MMEDKNVSEFVLAVFIEWVRKTTKRRVADPIRLLQGL
jgi:hypothetical protein